MLSPSTTQNDMSTLLGTTDQNITAPNHQIIKHRQIPSPVVCPCYLAATEPSSHCSLNTSTMMFSTKIVSPLRCSCRSSAVQTVIVELGAEIFQSSLHPILSLFKDPAFSFDRRR